MKTLDLVATAVANTFRSKTRTILTILAIFVGAFTLTITNGLGTGINRYIDDTVASLGAADVMTVTKASESAGGLPNQGPAEYDPDAVSTGQAGPPGSGTVTALTPTDLGAIAAIDGVVEVAPIRSISADYVQYDDGTKYVASVGQLVAGQDPQLAAGSEPDPDASQAQLALPVSFVEPLGFADADDALGSTVTIAITDADRTQHLIEAAVVGVAEEAFGIGGGLIPNAALSDELFDLQSAGLSEVERERYAQASVSFDPTATDDEIAALQDRLAEAGYDSTTVADQLGTFKSVIDGIVLLLNVFAIIALLAASFGIVNTLLMSVQERTREIGLMKAMGMSSAKVFALFSFEAIYIGLLGSAIGAAIGILVGSAASSVLAGSLFADLPGLTLIAFDPVTIAITIAAVAAVAFVAGTLPAIRAASSDPVESLRYE